MLTTDDLVASDNCFFSATAITDGDFLRGVRFYDFGATTQSLVVRSRSGTVRTIETFHRHDKLEEFTTRRVLETRQHALLFTSSPVALRPASRLGSALRRHWLLRCTKGASCSVSNLLEGKGHDVATISQERTVTDALALLKERGIGALVVTGAKPPLVGIFSERDAVRAIAARGAAALDEKVVEADDARRRDLHRVDRRHELMVTMTERRIRHVPVVDDEQLVGIVSIGDVVKARLDELEHDKKDLLDYVSGR